MENVETVSRGVYQLRAADDTPGNDFGPADGAAPKEANDDSSSQPEDAIVGMNGALQPVG